MGFTADAFERAQGYLTSRDGDAEHGASRDDSNREASVIDWRILAPWKQKKSEEVRNLEEASEKLLQAVEGMNEALKKRGPVKDDRDS